MISFKKLMTMVAFATTAFAVASIPEVLVKGASPSEFEQKAEDELQLFWEQMFGKKLAVVENAGGRPAIYLGRTAFAEKNGADGEACDREEWLLKTVGDSLIVTGGRPVGTLYGVYAMLEKLGVAFIEMDETVIPKAPADMPKFDEKRKPDFQGRLIYDSIAVFMHRINASDDVRDRYRTWLLRSRINGKQIRQIVPYYVGGIYNMSQPSQYHSFSDFIEPKYFDEHPEYFGMDEFGKRRKPKSYSAEGTICMSNPDVRRITLEKLREYIKKDHETRSKDQWSYLYDISTLDNSPNLCLCPECKKIIDFEGSQTGLLLDYINYVATEIAKEYPEIIIRTFGYSASRVPPKKIMPAKNVLIQLTDRFTVSDPFKPLESQSSEMMDYFAQWCSTGTPIMLWDYWNIGGTYYNPPRIETVFNALQPDMRFFKRNNFIALFLEAEIDHAAPQNFMMLNYFVANRLMVDVDADVDALADTFIDGYYGPSASVMRKYFNVIREGVRKDPQKANTAVVGPWRFVTPKLVFDMRKEMLEAVAKLPADSKYAARVRAELVAPLCFAFANWPSFSKVFGEAGIDRKQLLEECRRLSGEYTHRYECKNPAYGDKAFNEKMGRFMIEMKIPERFANIPEKDFRMINYNSFRGLGNLFSALDEDKDSMHGKALRVNDPRPEFTGVNKKLPGQYGFITTEFVLGNHKADGKVRTVLKSVPTDEKYHWYRLPGSIELKSPCYFWGDGWAIQANVSSWYVLTDGNPLDNTWDQVWMSAKFTGPDYVPGSTKENGIFVDMVCILRNQPDPMFEAVGEYPAFDAEMKAWEVNGYYKNTGSVKVVEIDGAKGIEVTASAESQTVAQGPIVPCAPDDLFRIRVRNSGDACEAGLYFFKEKGFAARKFVKLPNNGLKNEVVIDASDLKNDEIRRCRVVFYLPKGNGKAVFQDLELSVAHHFNKQ
ncbi:MAG: DUF4838 domain-containing protein [Victivallales bacterium]|nr:DUF4838 domain-containing protein [Victivallales bacterium]